ncbi:MAG: hypothetical protein P1U78_11530 [Alcanivoracaceae bacterium]|nr:hypothetical protein [Alcanivoracaceae bacterium]
MSQDSLNTNTSQWSLAIHRVTQSSAEIWVGTLFPFMKMPDHARVVIRDTDDQETEYYLNRSDWQRPFRQMSQRFCALVTVTDLSPGKQYQVRFERRIEALVDIRPEPFWQCLRDGEFGTLPGSLPDKDEAPFTIGLGSCFYNHRDGGHAAAAYRAIYENGGHASPDITFLSGDQVYLDIGFDSLSLIAKEIRERIAMDYALHWQALGSILTRGGTWMLPDDHEYWNDYPFYDSLLPTLLPLKLSSVRRAWSRASRDGVSNIQRSALIETFSIGNELSFCVADLRSYRRGKRFLPDQAFARLCDWARGLACPGVLLVPQPVIVGDQSLERNLRGFPEQYSALLAALGSSGHDVVLLSGDVHFGRIASVPLGSQGGKLVEIISSPLSNLTGLNGVATASAALKPKLFPDNASAARLGWPVSAVDYHNGSWTVSTRPGFLLSAYPKTRTREHFMTVGFRRDGLGGVSLEAHAWRVRERSGPDNMPVADFHQPFITGLR